MISSDMIFENEHLFWKNTSWRSGEESNQYHGPIGRKNPECNSVSTAVMKFELAAIIRVN